MAAVSLQSINGLVRGIYAGVGERNCLAEAVKGIRRLLDGSGAMLLWPTQARDETGGGFADGFDVGFYARYLNEIRDRDVWLEAAISKGFIRAGSVFTDEMLIPDCEFKRLPIYHQAHVPMDATRVCSGVVVGEHDPDFPPVLIAVFRGPRGTPFGTGDCRVLELLSPHLEQALRLSRRLVQANTIASTTADIFDRLGCGIVLLDVNRKIRYMNRLAECLCVRERGLLVCRGKTLGQTWLSALGRRHDTELQKVITQSLLAMDRSRDQNLADCPRPFAIYSPSGGTLVVRAMPIAMQGLTTGANDARVIILIESPDEQARVDGAAVAELFGLTPAESRIATALLRGEKPKTMAVRLGVSENTVRTHVKALHAKTGARGQAALIATLARAAGALSVRVGVPTHID